jgi:hypothetical protein
MGRYSKRPCRCSFRQRGLTGGFWTNSTKKLLLASIHSFKCCQNTAGIKFSLLSISWPGQEVLSCAAIGMTIRCFLLHTLPKLPSLVRILAGILPLTPEGHSLRLFPYISEFLSMLDDLAECEFGERLTPESGQRANESALRLHCRKVPAVSYDGRSFLPPCRRRARPHSSRGPRYVPGTYR